MEWEIFRDDIVDNDNMHSITSKIMISLQQFLRIISCPCF